MPQVASRCRLLIFNKEEALEMKFLLEQNLKLSIGVLKILLVKVNLFLMLKKDGLLLITPTGLLASTTM